MPAVEAPDVALSAHAPADAHETDAPGTVQIPIEAQEAGGIQMIQAALRPIESSIEVNGVVSPDQTRVFRIRPLSPGVVETVFVHVGDRVEAGAPLLRYDNIELGLAIGEFLSASADLTGRRAELDMQEAVLSRSRQMLEAGAIARTEYEVRSAKRRNARAQVDAAQARVAQFEEQLHRFELTEEEVERLEEDAGSFHHTASITTLRTPTAGIVTASLPRLGATVDGSTALMTVADITKVWVLAEVFEHHLGSVRLGADVWVRVPAYPATAFRGRVTYVSDTVDLETRAVPVRCVVDNPGALLKFGMFASVEILERQSAPTLAVPSSAIQTVGGQTVVFVKRSSSTFELTEVETGVEGGGWIEVREGLSSGDTVITDGSFYAKTATLRELIGHHH